MSANDPAFPGFEPFEKQDDSDGPIVTHMLPVGGLSKREYYAAMALPACIGFIDLRNPPSNPHSIVAAGAVAFADQLLAELQKERT